MKNKALRAQLAKLVTNPRELAKAAPTLCRATSGISVLAIRKSGGGTLSADERKDLLARAVAKEEVELEVDVLAYEQRPGEHNRNFVRFRDGAMQALGRSGKGTPFLRNHDQYDVQARAGTVLSSSTEKILGAEGHAIKQTVKLTAPWAVELALRGLLDSVSIGWNPTGPILCSACDAPIFSQCWHLPGDTLSEEKLSNGKGSKLKRDPNGQIVVEFVFTEAELVETSFVNVPGVPAARVEDVRAALSAAFPGLRSEEEHEGEDHPEGEIMDPELLKLLGLAADATADDVLAAVQAKLTAAEADKAKLAIAQNELSQHQAAIDELQADKRQRDEDKFVRDALDSGRISVGEESNWRRLFKADQKGAVEEMGKRKAGQATPVGQPRQSAAADPAPQVVPVITGGEPARRQAREPLVGRGVAGLLPRLQSDPRASMFAGVFGLDYEAAGLAGVPRTLGATTIANNADMDAARVGFHAAFLQSLEQNADDPVSMLYTTVPSSRSVEEWNFMGDLPGFEEWDTDRKLATLKGFKLRVENKKWANGIRVKNDDFKDDALGLLPSQVTGLAQKARRHRWDLMVKLLLNGFDGTAYPEVGNGLAYDGAFFFSDSHLGGNDNKMATALDAAGLAAAELLLASMTTFDGNDPLDVYGTHLIVGPKLRTTAEKLLQQERLANGEDNINRGKYKLIVSNRIRGTYDDYWFLADLSGGIKPLLFQMREEISTSETGPNGLPAFQADELWFGAQARYNVGYFEPRLIVGSAVA